jgi:hypothetical protein
VGAKGGNKANDLILTHSQPGALCAPGQHGSHLSSGVGRLVERRAFDLQQPFSISQRTIKGADDHSLTHGAHYTSKTSSGQGCLPAGFKVSIMLTYRLQTSARERPFVGIAPLERAGLCSIGPG